MSKLELSDCCKNSPRKVLVSLSEGKNRYSVELLIVSPLWVLDPIVLPISKRLSSNLCLNKGLGGVCLGVDPR